MPCQLWENKGSDSELLLLFLDRSHDLLFVSCADSDFSMSLQSLAFDNCFFGCCFESLLLIFSEDDDKSPRRERRVLLLRRFELDILGLLLVLLPTLIMLLWLISNAFILKAELAELARRMLRVLVLAVELLLLLVV